MLNTFNHHYTETHFIFSMFVPISLGLGLFMSFLCDLFFNLTFIFIFINLIAKFKQRHLFFVHSLEYLQLFLGDNLHDVHGKCHSNSKSSASGCCLNFAWFFANFSLALLLKKSDAYRKKAFMSILLFNTIQIYLG